MVEGRPAGSVVGGVARGAVAVEVGREVWSAVRVGGSPVDWENSVSRTCRIDCTAI